MKELTRQQAKILDFLERSPTPPSVRETMEHMGFRSLNGARDHMEALRRKGRITWPKFKARQIAVVTPLTLDERIRSNLKAIDRCTKCGAIRRKP